MSINPPELPVPDLLDERFRQTFQTTAKHQVERHSYELERLAARAERFKKKLAIAQQRVAATDGIDKILKAASDLGYTVYVDWPDKAATEPPFYFDRIPVKATFIIDGTTYPASGQISLLNMLRLELHVFYTKDTPLGYKTKGVEPLLTINYSKKVSVKNLLAKVMMAVGDRIVSGY